MRCLSTISNFIHTLQCPVSVLVRSCQGRKQPIPIPLRRWRYISCQVRDEMVRSDFDIPPDQSQLVSEKSSQLFAKTGRRRPVHPLLASRLFQEVTDAAQFSNAALFGHPRHRS